MPDRVRAVSRRLPAHDAENGADEENAWRYPIAAK